VSRRRTPRPLAAAVHSALERVEPATLLASVQRAWAGAVGEAVAREAIPVTARDGVVTVACRSSTWAQELDLLSDQILARLRAELPSDGGLEGLRFSVSADPF
jgi:predicted nucleic acid-binding Zn ribbon protein